MASRRKPSSRHGWNSWDNYLNVHQHQLRDFEHFISSNQLSYTVTDTLVSWQGELHCAGGIEIHVRKTQEVEPRGGGWPMVKTFEYSYQVMRRQAGQAISIFRYDNVHVQPGHPDAHHKHCFDEHGTEIEPPVHVGEAGWPTLAEVVREAYELNLLSS